MDDRFYELFVIAERVGGHGNFMALHPIDVALQRVDLAIVREHAERLRETPLRERVGAVALVIDHDGGDETLVFEIGIERVDLRGEEHALVDERLR